MLSVEAISGLVGGDEALVRLPSESSEVLEDGEEADLGYRSGALYASILVVCVNSVGPEILWRIDPEYPRRLLVVLLRCGIDPFDSFKSIEGFARRVVNARASDMLVVAE